MQTYTESNLAKRNTRKCAGLSRTAIADDRYDPGLRLGLDAFRKKATTHNTDTLPKSAFRYIENHYQSRFLAGIGVIDGDDPLFDKTESIEVVQGERPYLIALRPRKRFLCFGKDKNWERTTLFRNEGPHESVCPCQCRGNSVRTTTRAGRFGVVYEGSLGSAGASNAPLREGDFFFYNDWEQTSVPMACCYIHARRRAHFRSSL